MTLKKVAQRQKTLLFPQRKLIRRRYARKRWATVECFQLRQPRTASSARPPVARPAGHDRRGAPAVTTTVQQAVCENRATIDSTGEAVLVLQALYSVRSERILMESRLQPAVSLVRGLEHG